VVTHATHNISPVHQSICSFRPWKFRLSFYQLAVHLKTKTTAATCKDVQTLLWHVREAFTFTFTFKLRNHVLVRSDSFLTISQSDTSRTTWPALNQAVGRTDGRTDRRCRMQKPLIHICLPLVSLHKSCSFPICFSEDTTFGTTYCTANAIRRPPNPPQVYSVPFY
jgi:hypothetical protein